MIFLLLGMLSCEGPKPIAASPPDADTGTADGGADAAMDATFDAAHKDAEPLEAGTKAVERYTLRLNQVGKERIPLGKGPNSESVEIADNRIMLVDHAQGKEIEVAKNDEKAGCLSLWSPVLVDPKTILVQCMGYEAATIHNKSICLIDIPSKKMYLLGRRTHCALPITQGRYKGHFFVDAMDFKVGQGIWEAPRVVNRRGQALKDFLDHPFREDWDGDGMIQGPEMEAPCSDPPMPQDKLEALMKKM